MNDQNVEVVVYVVLRSHEFYSVVHESLVESLILDVTYAVQSYLSVSFFQQNWFYLDLLH